MLTILGLKGGTGDRLVLKEPAALDCWAKAKVVMQANRYQRFHFLLVSADQMSHQPTRSPHSLSQQSLPLVV